MTEAHDVRDAELSGTTLTMIVDGRQYRFDVTQVSKKLARATPQQRENFEVSPSGYGIHWPDLDEDLSIDGLLGVVHAPENRAVTTAADRRRS
jgi:hypothetical protein